VYTLALVILRKQDAVSTTSAINFTNARSAVSLCYIKNASKTGFSLQVQSWSSDHITYHFSECTKINAANRGISAQKSPSAFYPPQKRPQWVQLLAWSRANVFEKDITLPGRSEVSLAATKQCRLQLCTVLWTSASKAFGHYYTIYC